MTKSVYFTAAEGNSGTPALARLAVAQLKQDYPKLGVFRAFTNGPIAADQAFVELAELAGSPTDGAWGTTRAAYIEDENAAMTELIKRYNAFAAEYDAVLVLGLVDGDPVNPGALRRTGRAAANIGASILLVMSGALRTIDEITNMAHLAALEIQGEGAEISGVAVTSAPKEVKPVGSAHTPIIYLFDGEEPALTDSDKEVLKAAMEHGTTAVTPLAFRSSLISRAQANKKRIVLPEASDERILRAADELIRLDVASIILVGEEEDIKSRAADLGLDLSAAEIVSPKNPELIEKYATEFARLRAKKGVTYEQAVEKLADLSYFGTMMVHMGDADGMVSGAIHTTANTIVPSFQIIKTKPGAGLVSSCFLMLMKDRVHVYADCAVTTNPTPEQLAGIAISSAETAKQFGVDPRIAMLSYSTGTSGKGPDVDAVVEATRIAREARPDLMIEGPIQFDAAVDAKVAATKLPESDVAGRANVFIFPELNAGNIGYKAVQRSSGAVAVGPVLQGLNKPVNDLSRGALVEDIVNTVAITAVQAQ